MISEVVFYHSFTFFFFSCEYQVLKDFRTDQKPPTMLKTIGQALFSTNLQNPKFTPNEENKVGGS